MDFKVHCNFKFNLQYEHIAYSQQQQSFYPDLLLVQSIGKLLLDMNLSDKFLKAFKLVIFLHLTC